MAEKELKNLQIEIKKLTKKLDSLDIKLSKHIVFIEQVYAPLQKSIDKFNNFNKNSIHPKLKHIPDTNYWHYSLQLNVYKTILEQKYGFIVKDLHLVVIHPENAENYVKIKLPIMEKEIETIFMDLVN